MPFPYPENPKDWQTAYTSERAYRDARKHGNNFILPIFFCFLILLVYVCLHTMPFPFFETYAPAIRVGLAIMILILFFLLFTLIVFIPARPFCIQILF